MKLFHLKHVAIGLAMLAAAGLSVAMTPTKRIADAASAANLEAMVPKTFGDWKLDELVVPLMISPDVQAKLDKIYNQTLSRTYVNGRGARVMLSIAYGGDQSDAMQVHKPEVCYPAQGFQILKEQAGQLSTQSGEIPVKRIVASKGERVEPITYWIRVGEKVALGAMERKLEQVRFALTGVIPDGLLFRVSSIGADEPASFALQEDFVRQLLPALSGEARLSIVGRN